MAPSSTPPRAASHEMLCEAETVAEALFVCMDEGCGRRVVVGKSPPRVAVIDRGDFWVRHAGLTGGATIDQVTVA
jgi:hypothetical protein